MFFDLFSDILISDTAGPVWDLNLDRSLLHGASGTCRCTLEIEVELDWEQIQELRELRELLRTQGIHISLVKEVYKLSSVIAEARAQVEAFRPTFREFIGEVSEANDELTIYLALGRRAGSEDIRTLISLFQQGRITAEMFTRAMITLTAVSGPWGWVLGFGQLALSGLMLSDMMAIRRPRY